jgi:hypothetical protein
MLYALEMADGDAWTLIYSFGVSILRQTPRTLTRHHRESKTHKSRSERWKRKRGDAFFWRTVSW